MGGLKLNSTNGSVTLTPEDGTGAVDVTVPRGNKFVVEDTSGNVGIGTSSPNAPLVISNDTNKTNVLEFDPDLGGGDSARILSYDRNGGTRKELRIDAYSTKFLINNGIEKMIIDASGNVVFKQGSANALVPAVNNTGIYTDNIYGHTLRFNTSYANNKGSIIFYNNGTLVGSIVQNTTSTSYNTSSDYRLKEDIQELPSATTRLMVLNPCNFAWKSDGSRVDGFIAHELQEVVPEAVTGTKDAMIDEEYEVTPAVYETVEHPAVEATYDEDGNILTEAQEAYTEEVLVTEATMGTRTVPDYQGIDQSKLVPLLTKALQEAVERIEALEAKVNTA